LVCRIQSAAECPTTNAGRKATGPIDGSLLLTNKVTVTFTPLSASPVIVNEGTGKFRGLRGTIVHTNIGTSNNADVTIKLSSSQSELSAVAQDLSRRGVVAEVVYVELLDGSVQAWRPVEAEVRPGGHYRLAATAPEDEASAFPLGSTNRLGQTIR
jgi:hypothetical protein